jgi:hypothetical protein
MNNIFYAILLIIISGGISSFATYELVKKPTVYNEATYKKVEEISKAYREKTRQQLFDLNLSLQKSEIKLISHLEKVCTESEDDSGLCNLNILKGN